MLKRKLPLKLYLRATVYIMCLKDKLVVFHCLMNLFHHHFKKWHWRLVDLVVCNFLPVQQRFSYTYMYTFYTFHYGLSQHNIIAYNFIWQNPCGSSHHHSWNNFATDSLGGSSSNSNESGVNFNTCKPLYELQSTFIYISFLNFRNSGKRTRAWLEAKCLEQGHSMRTGKLKLLQPSLCLQI